MGMSMISVEKPGTPTEILEHTGVKGMRWGVRNRAVSRDFKTRHPTGASRDAAIKRARLNQQARLLKAASQTNEKKRTDLTKVYLNHPDRATALRMTRGEKAVFGLLGVALAPTGVGVGIGVGTAARVAARRSIERKQVRK